MEFGQGDDAYRTCSECGQDLQPQPLEADGHLRISFVCAEHGVHTVVSPFED